MSGRPGIIEGLGLAWRQSSPGTRGATATLLAALAVAGLTGWPLARAIIGPRVEVPELSSPGASAELAGQFATLVKEIDGRSLFIVPGPPAAPEPEAAPVADTSDKPPPRPTTYGGPAITAMVNDTVWFRDGKRLVSGAEASGDLKVVRVNGPWDAVVMWKGVEFTVPLFTRDRLVLKDSGQPPAPTAPAAPPPEAPASEPAPPAPAPPPETPATSPGEVEPPKPDPATKPETAPPTNGTTPAP